MLPSVASADFGVQPGGFQSNILDSSGAVVPSPQAGAHPYAQQINLKFNTKQNSYPASPDGQNPPSGPDPDPDGEAKTVIANLPAGFLGNPQAVPRCEQRDFPPPSFGGYSRCAPASQVGIASLDLGRISGYPNPPGAFKVPVYNLAPPKGVVARLGFVEVSLVVIDITLRTGSDYGITATIRNLSEAPNIYGSSVTLWGVPADSSHDAERYRSGAVHPR